MTETDHLPHKDQSLDEPALYRLENVVRRYNGRVVLDLPEFSIRAGEVLGIMGHNGSGKSTLLRILALLEAPDEGRLWLDNEPVSVDKLSQRRKVSLLLQTPYLLSRSVEANIAYGLAVRGLRGKEARQRVEAAMAAVGLDPAIFSGRRRHELSGGEAQRVALAARLALRPRILLMDEPTASVDEESAALIATAARSVARSVTSSVSQTNASMSDSDEASEQGCAVIIVSHDFDWLSPLAHRLIRLKNGKETKM